MLDKLVCGFSWVERTQYKVIYYPVDSSTTVFPCHTISHDVIHGTGYPNNHNVELMSNSGLLGTLCEKRYNAIVVMDNKIFYSTH